MRSQEFFCFVEVEIGVADFVGFANVHAAFDAVVADSGVGSGSGTDTGAGVGADIVAAVA